MAWGASQLSDTIFLKEGIAYEYNNHGKLTFEKQFLPNYKESLPSANYEYNDLGELVRIQKNLGQLGNCAVDIFESYETIIYKYSNGLLIESIRERMAQEAITYREIVIYYYNRRGLLIKEKTITYNLNERKELVEDWSSLDKYQYKYYRR